MRPMDDPVSPISFPLTLTLSPKVLPIMHLQTAIFQGGNTLGERGLT
jgi:hypothetical protein